MATNPATQANQHSNQHSFESRAARLLRLRREVQSGTYRVDTERLALCIVARSSETLASRFAGRDLDVRVAC